LIKIAPQNLNSLFYKIVSL